MSLAWEYLKHSKEQEINPTHSDKLLPYTAKISSSDEFPIFSLKIAQKQDKRQKKCLILLF